MKASKIVKGKDKQVARKQSTEKQEIKEKNSVSN